MIAIIDYGMGNLYSVEKAFVKLGAEAVVSSDSQVIATADRVVLPGVGAFGDCMRNLRDYGLVDVVRQVIADGKPFLGICLGLQMLFEGSEEDPDEPGLGVFAGMVRRITANGLKVPQISWNSLDLTDSAPLFNALPQPASVYFVHSYHAVPDDSGLITATTEYGGRVIAAVGRANVQAVQFHPEKSGTVGLQILRNFMEMSV